jgi:hypothetical protein
MSKDQQLRDLIAEVGRLIEEMPYDERKERVQAVLDDLVPGLTGDARSFVTGLFVVAHEWRLAREMGEA